MSFRTTSPFRALFSLAGARGNGVCGAEVETGSCGMAPGGGPGLATEHRSLLEPAVIQEPWARDALLEGKGEGISSTLKPLLRINLVVKPNILVPGAISQENSDAY